MYRQLFKNRKGVLGLAAFMIVTVIVLFSGENSLVSQITDSFGAHDEVAADQPVAVETVHPAEVPVLEEQAPPNDEDTSFVEDEELVDDSEGFDPTPPEESVGGSTDESGDENASAEDDGYNGEQVIIVNPGAPQPG